MRQEKSKAKDEATMADMKRKEAEGNKLNIGKESFVNDVAQLRILNPGLKEEGSSHLFLV